MEVGKGLAVIEKGINNLVLTKKRIKKVERLHAGQLATFKKGVFTACEPSVIEESKKIKLIMRLQQLFLDQDLNP